MKYQMAYTKEAFHEIMVQTKKWTERTLPGATNPLPPDVDFMATCMNTPTLLPGKWYSKAMNTVVDGIAPGVLWMEFVYGNFDPNDPNREASLKELTDVRDAIIAASKKSLRGRIIKKSFDGPMPLSEISNNFVRRELISISEGREFANPYEKSCHITFRPLTQDFVDRYVDHVDETINNSSGLQMVHQQVLGGGVPTYQKNRDATSMGLRDCTIELIFDVFHPPSAQGRKDAMANQAQMTKLLPSFQGDTCPDYRCIWGSFGDTDIKKCWDNYYQTFENGKAEADINKYKQLIAIKNHFDAKNIFETPFTIPLEYADPPNFDEQPNRRRPREPADDEEPARALRPRLQ